MDTYADMRVELASFTDRVEDLADELGYDAQPDTRVERLVDFYIDGSAKRDE